MIQEINDRYSQGHVRVGPPIVHKWEVPGLPDLQLETSLLLPSVIRRWTIHETEKNRATEMRVFLKDWNI